MFPDALAGAQQVHECISRRERITRGAGMARRTAPIELARCDTRNPKPRAFRTPDWAVTIPDMCGRAQKRLVDGDNWHLQCKD